MFVSTRLQKDKDCFKPIKRLNLPMTPVPYSIATSDGFFTKPDKSKSLTSIVKTQEGAIEPHSSETLVILDGNACFYYLKGVPGSFDQMFQKVFDVMPKSGDAAFSTDTYVVTSVKVIVFIILLFIIIWRHISALLKVFLL